MDTCAKILRFSTQKNYSFGSKRLLANNALKRNVVCPLLFPIQTIKGLILQPFKPLRKPFLCENLTPLALVIQPFITP